MRDWARRELNGYEGEETVPKYRQVPAVLMVVITNSAGYNGTSVRLDPAVFPTQVRDMLRKNDVDLNDAVLGGGIGELEALNHFHPLGPGHPVRTARRDGRTSSLG
jgi:hypothetical protein